MSDSAFMAMSDSALAPHGQRDTALPRLKAKNAPEATPLRDGA
jgi:hypothetical protein